MPEVTPNRIDEPNYINRPGQPGFVERRQRERGKGRRLLVYLGITAICSLALGRTWGIATVARTIIVSVTGADKKNQIEAPMEVFVVKPREGGLPRKIVQTGSIEPIETAELQPRVSGYIRNIAFEIGEFVEAGQVVVQIDADELKKDVEKQAALVELAESKVRQAQARLKTTGADRDAAKGMVQKTQSEVVRSMAEVALREKELLRIQMLVAEKAIELKLADEKSFQLEAARAGVENAQAAEVVARAELLAIDSRIERAEADVSAAEADVRVARADLERARVMAGYLRITSPFSGVVTARNFDRGDFVHAASGGGNPILTIARTDRMRAVLRIPAPDVPFVQPGQPAHVSVSSLGGKTFDGIISRVARHQDIRTRTMRVEVDLANRDRELAGGMYGSVSIEVPAPTHELSLPESCLVGRALNGQGRVYQVVDGRLVLRPVGVGRSYGDRIEILEGIGAEDMIVTGETHDFGALRSGRLATITRKTKLEAVDPSKIEDISLDKPEDEVSLAAKGE
ncbi:MAG: efflux RND transporter periplasmic adaptor subunit [Planctomycetota bacterium]